MTNRLPSLRHSLACTVLLCGASVSGLSGQGADGGVQSVRAERLSASEQVQLDGRLNEEVWRVAGSLGPLTLREPVEGEPAPERTEVRFVYTAEALYIGARMHSAEADQIGRLIARRDREVPTEQLLISFDPRLDRTTAYTFAVTPGGVRFDAFHPVDREGAQDTSYDPVWEARTTVDARGWTAEIRIPFSQLRFNTDAAQEWGLNVVRSIPRRNEEALWVLVPRDDTGWSSRMGRLTGLSDIGGDRRVEILPYIASGATRSSEIDPSDPFAERVAAEVRAGTDIKIGVGPSLTLDATINPDFGQVEADPAEVNLTAFETFFSERRPFFLEGGNLFGGRNHFYSRRIGAAPPLRPSAPYADVPDNSTILGAAKLTGRLPSGLSIGALGALTASEDAPTFDPDGDVFGTEEVAPRTVYGVLSASQELGEDRSTIGVAVTAVDRSLEQGSALAQRLPDQAYTALLDGRWRWAGGRFDASAYIGVSHVTGDSAAILRLQRSSRRYFQRPDAGHVSVDPTRTSLTGMQAGINHSKSAGRWRWDVDYVYESPELELNDVGRLGSTDEHAVFTNLQYRQTVPGPTFHNWFVGAFSANDWNGGGVFTGTFVNAYAGVTWKNFWGTEVDFSYEPRSVNDDITRGGPLMSTPSRVSASAEVSGNPGARTRWEINLDAGSDELDGWLWAARGSLAFRPATQWEVSVQPGFVRRVAAQQYVATLDGGPAETFGQRYVFGRLDRSEIVARLRASFALQSDLTLEAYVEPFASTGSFDRLGELTRARGLERREYGTDGSEVVRTPDGRTRVTDGDETFVLPNRDFDVTSLRSNLVLRWEWRAGSTLFLVWQQDRFSGGLPTERAGLGSLFDAVTVPGDHFFALKVSYWLPI